ncbi:MAG: hypothetical protein AAGA02_11260 [Bacteroidota bacterium]
MKTPILLISLFIFSNCAAQQPASTTRAENTVNSQDAKSTSSEDKADITGVWKMTITTGRGTRDKELIISLENGEYKGKSDKNDFDITRNGSQLKWTDTINSPMSSMQAEFSMMLEGTEMTGTVQASGRTLNVVGKRE